MAKERPALSPSPPHPHLCCALAPRHLKSEGKLDPVGVHSQGVQPRSLGSFSSAMLPVSPFSQKAVDAAVTYARHTWLTFQA